MEIEMTDITGDLDLLGDWLDAKGYTEEAGLCTRAMDEINRLRAELADMRERCKLNYELGVERGKMDAAAEIARLHQAMHDIYEVYAGSEGFIPETCPEAYLQDSIKEMAYIAAKYKRGRCEND